MLEDEFNFSVGRENAEYLDMRIVHVLVRSRVAIFIV